MPEQRIPVGNKPLFLTHEDLNGDGFVDLITTNNQSHNLSIMSGFGDGTFESAQDFENGFSPRATIPGDFNGDGIWDLASVNGLSEDITVLPGIGDGTFMEAGNRFATGANPTSIAKGDFNGDGLLDLAVANRDTNDVSVFFGLGNATFAAEQRFAVGQQPRWVMAGDFNADGLTDLATANAVSDDVVVLFNRSTAGVPSFAQISPATYNITRGQYGSGAHSDLVQSDNRDLVVRRDIATIQSHIRVEFEATSFTSSPDEFMIRIEAAVFARSTVNQKIDLYDFSTSTFEEVDSRTAPTNTDLVAIASPNGDLSRFVQPGSNLIRARVRFESTNPRQRFSANIDHVQWSVCGQ